MQILNVNDEFFGVFLGGEGEWKTGRMRKGP